MPLVELLQSLPRYCPKLKDTDVLKPGTQIEVCEKECAKLVANEIAVVVPVTNETTNPKTPTKAKLSVNKTSVKKTRTKKVAKPEVSESSSEK